MLLCWPVTVLEGERGADPAAGGGFAAACFEALRRHYRSLGKQPVWGAHHSNPASLRLAARLGFVPAARLEIFIQP